MAVLALKQLPYEHIPSMPFSGDEELAGVSPLSKVPALIDGDLNIADSKVICRYLESAYPYTAKDGTCQYNEADATNVILSGMVEVNPSDANALKAAVANGPTAVSIEADTFYFQSYRSGVLDSTACGTQLDHAVLAAGYGTENGQEYWLVKNSWGAGWGENGYVKIAIVDGDGICGVQMAPVYPLL